MCISLLKPLTSCADHVLRSRNLQDRSQSNQVANPDAPRERKGRCLVREASDFHGPDSIGIRRPLLLVHFNLSPALLPASHKGPGTFVKSGEAILSARQSGRTMRAPYLGNVLSASANDVADLAVGNHQGPLVTRANRRRRRCALNHNPMTNLEEEDDT